MAIKNLESLRTHLQWAIELEHATLAPYLSARCWQTNSNQSLVCQGYCPLCLAKTAPLSESSGAVGFEMISLGETALLVEVVEDGRVDGGKLLKTSHAPEPKHRPLPSSEGEV